MIKNFKNTLENLDKKIIEIPTKTRFFYHIISILFALFFVSAPLAMALNLLLFVQYILYVDLALAILLFVFVLLKNIIFISIAGRKLNEKLYNKKLIIIYILEALFYSLILLVVLLVCTKGYIW